MAPDNELLARWLRTRSEQDFAELVQRHLAMVHSAALRVVNGDRHLADDVAQTVFADLARKARSLTDRPSLAGWLHTSARFAAMGLLRGEHRRRQREQEALSMPQDPAASDAPAWSELQPVIDAAIGDLSAKDREALLLRYFENRSHREIGELLGLTDNAARMRVERALDKARSLLAKRGITSSTSGLAAALLAHGTLVTTTVTTAQITTTALTTATAAGSGFTLLHLMTATQLKTGLAVTALVAGLSVPLALQHRANAELRIQNATLSNQLTRLTELEAENNRLRGETVDRAELEALRSEHEELLRLRREVESLALALEESRHSQPRIPAGTTPSVALSDEAGRSQLLARYYQDLGVQRESLRFLVGRWLKLKSAAYKPESSSEQDRAIHHTLAEREAEVVERAAVVAEIYRQLANARGDEPSSYAKDERSGAPILEPMSLSPSAGNDDPTTQLLYREPIAVSDANGQFRRFYWFADGHSEEVVQSHSDFSAWEKARGAQ